MMSNLIARLRMGTQVPEFELRQEAADEIERLTDQCIAEGRIVRKCNEEIERLRAALERIARGCDLSNEAQAIARQTDGPDEARDKTPRLVGRKNRHRQTD
jgi:hypothetical protein